MKKQTPQIRTLRKYLTKIVSLTRHIVEDAEYNFLSYDRPYHLRAVAARKHWRTTGKLTRTLNFATKHAKAVGDAKTIEVVDLLRKLALIVIEHCDYFPNNDYDAAEWDGQKYLTQLETQLVRARSILCSLKVLA